MSQITDSIDSSLERTTHRLAESMLGDRANEFTISTHTGQWDLAFPWKAPRVHGNIVYQKGGIPIVPPEIIDRQWTPAKKEAIRKAKAEYNEWLSLRDGKNKPNAKKRRPRKRKYRLKGDPIDE